MSVQTVTGTRLHGDVGVVLPHEHLVIDYGMMEGRPTPVEPQLVQRCVDVLVSLHEAGVGVIVDCTPPGYGRDLELLRELSTASGVRIVASTGSFCEQWHPQPAEVAAASADELTTRFTGELGPDEGCGVIKVATSRDVITPNEEKLLMAGARTHRATGAPIVSHTTEGLGLEQLDIYEREGADLSRVLISHVCSGSEPWDYAVAIARRGAYVGLDRLGHAAQGVDHWLRLIGHLKDAGVLHRVLLSHDSVQRFTGPEEIASHTFSDPTFLVREFLPALRKHGLTHNEVTLITETNPRRWLLGEEKLS